LSRSIGWDLIVILLKYLGSPLLKTIDVAERLIAFSARVGIPREVYVRVLGEMTLLSWHPFGEGEGSDGGDEVGNNEAGGLGLATDFTAHVQTVMRKFKNLVSALATVHPLIETRSPSKFLSTELSTLLHVFNRALRSADAKMATELVQLLLEFVKKVRPQLNEKSAAAAATKRPPLPPRVSTRPGSRVANPEAEDQLQSRLIASFLTHMLSGYLLHTLTPEQQSVNGIELLHPAICDGLDELERGLNIGWAAKYDEEVLRPHNYKVPNGRTLIDEERDVHAAQGDIRSVVDEIVSMCDKLGVKNEELLNLCGSGADGPADDEENVVGEIPAPKAADSVRLSKHGALFVLTHRLSTDPEETAHVQIYPEHSSVAEAFMIYERGQTQPAVIDSVLFLGLRSLHASQSLGDLPEKAESFFIYLQIFSVISNNASSASHRYLANKHVQLCLRAHPSEAVRLTYVHDTLLHCPFPSVKGAVVTMLKDEIVHAAAPVLRDGSSVPSTPDSIFGTPLCLSEIFFALFPDLEEGFGGGGGGRDDGNAGKAWVAFQDVYPCFAATLNLYLLLLLNRELAAKLGVADRSFADKVETRFLAPVRKRLPIIAQWDREQCKDTLGTHIQLVDVTMQTIEDAKGKLFD